jgi:hypothetical protein
MFAVYLRVKLPLSEQQEERCLALLLVLVGADVS